MNLPHLLHLVTLKVLTLIAKLGYLGLFFGMLGQAVGVPLPSEVMLSFGGYLAWSHDLSFVPVVLAGFAGDVAGAVIAYAIGYYGGRPLVLKFGSHTARELQNAERWFARFGTRAVLICKLLPGVRAFASFPAGITRMSFWLFVAYTSLGSVIWCMAFASLGFHLGKHWDSLATYFRPISFGLIALVVVGIGFWIWAHFRQARPNVPPSTDAVRSGDVAKS